MFKIKGKVLTCYLRGLWIVAGVKNFRKIKGPVYSNSIVTLEKASFVIIYLTATFVTEYLNIMGFELSSNLIFSAFNGDLKAKSLFIPGQFNRLNMAHLRI